MDDLPALNPYKTLNVPKDATLATIRSAHRKLVLSCHPDKVQDESAKKIKGEQFHQVQQAYEMLSDEKRRQRYDEKVKLDELRAEMASERGPPLSRRATDFEYGPPRGGPPPRRETRGDAIYETREPRHARYSDEDYPSPRQDQRPPSKSYDDYYHTSSARRSSGRVQEEKKKKTRDIEDERDRRRREREEEEYAREQRKKKSDKDKRRNTEAKSKNKFTPYMDSASDSEVEDRHHSSKREIPSRSRFEGIPMRSRDDPRKNGKSDRAYDDDDDDGDFELNSKISAQQEYINNRAREPIEIDPRRLARNRAASNLEPRPPPPPAVDSAKRSSVRRGYSSRQASPVRPSKKDRRSPEIVDPPSRGKPSLPGATSDPKGLRKGFWGSSKPQRAATYQHVPDFKQPPMRRSDTAPVDRGQRNEPLKSSNLKNMKAPSDTDTSDSDSEITEGIVTPVRPSLRPKTTNYRVRDKEDNYGVEPQEIYPPRAREGSPQIRRSTDRPGMSPRVSTTQTPPMARASSYASPQNERSPRPGFSRTESARPTPTKPHQSSRGGDKLLFGETIEEEDFGNRRSPKFYPEESSPYAKSYSRRGSEDVDRDAYPGSKFRQHRPHMERNYA